MGCQKKWAALCDGLGKEECKKVQLQKARDWEIEHGLWQDENGNAGPRGPDWMPIAAFGVMIMFAGFCLIAMYYSKPDPKDKYAGCEGWGPCLLFGGLTLALWIYLSIVGAGWV